MNDNLNLRLGQWLEQGGLALRASIDEEVDNRVTYYGKLRPIVLQRPLDMAAFERIALKCWVLRTLSKQLSARGFSKHREAQALVTSLIDDLPDGSREQAEHIQGFVEQAVELGFTTDDGRNQFAAAASYGSIALTTAYPKQFADFPTRKRWRHFAEQLGYPIPDIAPVNGHAHYGEWIVWSSAFARELAQQPIIRTLWPHQEPLWVVSGMCWSSGVELTGKQRALGLDEE